MSKNDQYTEKQASIKNVLRRQGHRLTSVAVAYNSWFMQVVLAGVDIGHSCKRLLLTFVQQFTTKFVCTRFACRNYIRIENFDKYSIWYKCLFVELILVIYNTLRFLVWQCAKVRRPVFRAMVQTTNYRVVNGCSRLWPRVFENENYWVELVLDATMSLLFFTLC